MTNSPAKRKTAKPKRTRTTKQDVQTIGFNRDHMISEAAYYLAEKRNFSGGDPLQDWLEAEKTIDRKTATRPSA